MTYTFLPLTEDPWQVFTLDLAVNGEPLHVRVDLRYLPEPDRWFLSLRDLSDGALLVNMIPVLCSRFFVNDLLRPFRHLRQGRGLGSLLCLRATDDPGSEDPARETLKNFHLLWGDDWPEGA